jgi:hypothetical protein
MNGSETPVTKDDTKGGWPYVVGPLGILLMGVSELSNIEALGAVAAAMLFSAGITAVIQMFRSSRNQESTPTSAAFDSSSNAPSFESPLLNAPMYSSASLVGARIRHRGGISVVTEDLDTPMPRRTVLALDTHGRPERLFVSVDEMGRVVEAAIPGSEWAAAEAI